MDRIPKSPHDFNDYIRNTDNYLSDPLAIPLNWMRLLLSLLIANAWHAQVVAWDILWRKYSDPLQSNGPVKDAVALFITAFKAFAQPHLNTMAACDAATSDDEAVFHFVRDAFHANPTHREIPIPGTVTPEIEHLGGQLIRTKSRVGSSTKRAHVPPNTGATGVNTSWAVSDKPDNGPANQDAAGTTKVVSPGATATLELDATTSGMYLNTWYQWYDSKHPKRASAWSVKYVTLIV